MRTATLWALLAGACSICAQSGRPRPRTYDTHDYYAVHLDPSTSPLELAGHLGMEHEGPLSTLDHIHMFRTHKQDADVLEDAIVELKRRRRRKRDASFEPHILDNVRFNQKQVARKRLAKRSAIPQMQPRKDLTTDAMSERAQVAKSLNIVDPIFEEQWHIYNTQQVGHDLNVTGVWLQGITGQNATVCIIDDGLDMDSLDLAPNYFAAGSYDFNEGVDEPKPRLSDDHHGTRCAGEVAAARNDVCGIGVAYESRIAGIRILSKPISDADEAESVVYNYQENDIYSCSWGPPDDGKTMEAPGILIQQAMVKAVQQGRGGKGTIYVFAAGNGAASGDNCNFDGYTNSIYSITVGAIDKTDNHPYYSEQCSAQLVVTYSSGAGDAIHTTDVGKNKCTKSHGGTSAAGPLAAGVYALVLSVRPDMTWRDMQWLNVMTAVPFDSAPNDWQETPLGRKYSHQYGYGKIDTYAIVEAAKTWKNVNPQAWLFSPWIHVKHPIPQGDQGLASSFSVTKDVLKDANLKRIEHVTVTMNIEHTRRGDLSVELRSPSGIISHLSVVRRGDEEPVGYLDWTFMSVAHWGEDGVGDWTVIVKDTEVNNFNGTFTDWKLHLYGESVDGSKQPLLPMPGEHDDDDHDVISTAPVGTTSITVPTGAPNPNVNPSSMPTRPAISKPTGDKAESAIPTTDTTFTIPSTPTAASTTTSIAIETATSSTSASTTPSSTSAPDSFLPSPFPTFGVSKRTQIWIYGALALILIFVGSLAAYFWIQRRKRLRNNPRDNYEFEMLEEHDDDAEIGGGRGMAGGALGAGRGGKKSRRAGELYDAFAGESDEDLELLSESEDERYRDEEDEAEVHDEKQGFGGGSSDVGSSQGSSSGSRARLR